MLFTKIFNQNKDFLKLYNKGSFIASNSCVVYYLKNNASFNRIGFTTGKKIGNAVLRNSAKRKMKAAYIKSELLFPIGFDIVIVAREGIENVKSTEIEQFFVKRAIPRMLNPDKNKKTNFNKNKNKEKK